MKLLNTLVAFLFLCVAVGMLYFLNNRDEKKEKAKDRESRILKFSADDIANITIKNTNGEFVLERSPDATEGGAGLWKLKSPVSDLADDGIIKKLVEDIGALLAKRSFSANDEELPDYGLEPPLLKMNIVSKDGKTQEIYTGNKNPDGNMQYLRADGSRNIKLVDSTLFDISYKKLKDLRNKDIVNLDREKVQRIEIHYKRDGRRFVIEKKDSEYHLTVPLSTKADGQAVTKFLSSIAASRADEFPSEDYSVDPSRWGLDKPQSQITLTLDDKSTVALDIGNDASKDGNFYVRNRKNRFVIEARGSLKKDLDLTLSGLVNKRIADHWESNDIDTLTLTQQGRSTVLERKGDLWTIKGINDLADQGKVSGIIQRLKNMVAGDFVAEKPGKDQGLERPHLMVTLSMKDGGTLTEYSFGRYYPPDKMYISGGPYGYVYEIGASIAEQIKKQSMDLRNKKLSLLERSDLTGFEISSGRNKISYERDGDEAWTVKTEGNLKYRPDDKMIGEDSAKIIDFALSDRISGYVGAYDSKAKSDFGFEKPELTLAIRHKGGEPETIHIGKPDPLGENFYAKVSTRDNIYKVGSHDVESLQSLFEQEEDKK